QLQEIILKKEWERLENFQQELEAVAEEIHDKQKLQVHLEPILTEYTKGLQEKFPDLFAPFIASALKNSIREAQNEMVDVLYPILGKMVKKYIIKELEVLSERIDNYVDKTFSIEVWWQYVKSWFKGNKTGENIIADLQEPLIEQVFVIEQHSGILLGSYTKKEAIDQDMVAGMLTAIKGFAKDALSEKKEEIELVDYETTKILVRNLHTFYIAVVISGVINKSYLSKLDDKIWDFSNRILQSDQNEDLASRNSKAFTVQLEAFFNKL
ncbi:MAG: hypothetical protein AAGI07_18330, partial [Bacteroidota bacterium]